MNLARIHCRPPGGETSARIGLATAWALMVLLAACASGPAPVTVDPCDPETAWRAALAGARVPDPCDTTNLRLWREAANLASEMRMLLAEQAAFDPELPGAALRKARIQRELDQLRGAATLRGWPLPDD